MVLVVVPNLAASGRHETPRVRLNDRPAQPAVQSAVNVTRDAYVRQLRYMDSFFDGLVITPARDPAARNATIVALSDHGFRFGRARFEFLYIPFLLRRAGQMIRENVVQPESVETLPQQTLINACEVPQPFRMGY